MLNITNFRNNGLKTWLTRHANGCLYTCSLKLHRLVINFRINFINVKTLKKAFIRCLCLGFGGSMGNYTFTLEKSNSDQKRGTSHPSIRDRLSWLPIYKNRCLGSWNALNSIYSKYFGDHFPKFPILYGHEHERQFRTPCYPAKWNNQRKMSSSVFFTPCDA